jgi:GTP:adenosylcobinamide-phosphate guanylyltransferase
VFSLICITRQTDQLKLLDRQIKELSEGKKLKIDKKIIDIQGAIKGIRDRLTGIDNENRKMKVDIKKNKEGWYDDVIIAIEEIRKDIVKVRVDIGKKKEGWYGGVITAIEEVRQDIRKMKSDITKNKKGRYKDLVIAINEIKSDIKQMKADISKNKSFHKKGR